MSCDAERSKTMHLVESELQGSFTLLQAPCVDGAADSIAYGSC